MVQKSILNDTPSNLIKKYVQVLERNNIPVDKVILFGSYAKNKAKPWSDVDVCIVSKKFGQNNYDEMVILKRLTSQVDSMIEPHPYSIKDLNDPYDELACEILKYGKIIPI